MQQWHLDVQHELFRNTVATVSYVGTKGTHLTLQQDLNQLYPVPASQNPFQPGQPITAAVCTPDSNGVYTVNNSTIAPGNPIYGNLSTACGNDPNPYRPNYPRIRHDHVHRLLLRTPTTMRCRFQLVARKVA